MILHLKCCYGTKSSEKKGNKFSWVEKWRNSIGAGIKIYTFFLQKFRNPQLISRHGPTFNRYEMTLKCNKLWMGLDASLTCTDKGNVNKNIVDLVLVWLIVTQKIYIYIYISRFKTELWECLQVQKWRKMGTDHDSVKVKLGGINLKSTSEALYSFWIMGASCLLAQCLILAVELEQRDVLVIQTQQKNSQKSRQNS